MSDLGKFQTTSNKLRCPSKLLVKTSWVIALCLFLSWFVIKSVLVDNFSDTSVTSHSHSLSRSQINFNTLSITEGSIFFMETSGHGCLTRRQVCSVESAARAMQERPIRVLFVKDPPKGKPSKHDPGAGDLRFRDCSATHSLLENRNVYFHTDSYENYLEGTLLRDWYLQGALNNSEFPMFHASDAMRIAILRKYGGLYLDLDCLVVRSLDELSNTAGMKDSRWIENGVLAFDAQHPFLTFYEHKFVNHYGSSGYDRNGPRLMSVVLQEFCNVTDMFAHTYNCRNSTITLRPAEDFYLIDFDHRLWFYNRNHPRYLDEVIKSKYLTHVYENDDGIHKAFPGSLYATLAEQYCPVAYSASLQKTAHF